MDVAPFAHARTCDMKFCAAAAPCSWRFGLLVLDAPCLEPRPELQVAEELATSRRRTSCAPGRPACCVLQRPVAQVLHATAPTAMISTSRQALRCRARPGSCGRRAGRAAACASSRPMRRELVGVVDRAQFVAAAGSRRRSRGPAAARGTGTSRLAPGAATSCAGSRPASDERRISGSVNAAAAAKSLLVVQADADAVGDAAAAAGALVGRRLAIGSTCSCSTLLRKL